MIFARPWCIGKLLPSLCNRTADHILGQCRAAFKDSVSGDVYQSVLKWDRFHPEPNLPD